MATLYYVIYPAALGDPSAAQVKAGLDATDTSATAAGSETARDTTGEQIFATTAGGLSPGTSYRVALVWSDGSNDSTVSVSAAWSTPSVFDEAVSESAAAADTAASTAAFTTAVSESAAAAEATTTQQTHVTAVADGGAASDVAGDQAQLLSNLADAAAATDASDGSVGPRTFEESVSDQASAADTSVSVGAFVHDVADLADAADAAADTVGTNVFNETVDESGVASEGVSSTANMSSALADAATAAEVAEHYAVWLLSLVDAAAATDFSETNEFSPAGAAPQLIVPVGVLSFDVPAPVGSIDVPIQP